MFPDSGGHFQQKSSIQLSRRAPENVQLQSALQSENKEVAVSVCGRTLGINYLLPPEPLYSVNSNSNCVTAEETFSDSNLTGGVRRWGGRADLSG